MHQRHLEREAVPKETARQPSPTLEPRRLGPAPSARTITAGIALLCLIWGSTWLVIREGLRDLPPFTSLAARLLVAGALFALVGPFVARKEGGQRPSLQLSMVHGFFVVALPYGIIYWAETTLSSGLTSVLWSVYPLLLGLTAHLLLPAERLVPSQWIGLCVGFFGVALMFATDIAEAGAASVRSGLVLLASPALSALGTTLLKRHGQGTSSALLNRNGMCLAALSLAILSWTAESGLPVRWSSAAIASVFYLALVGTVLAFGLYFWLLRHAPATRLSLIAYCTPVVAVTLGGTVGGEKIGFATLAGMALVFAGIGLVLTGKRR